VGQKTSLENGLAYLNKVLKKKSILMLFSDFFDTGYERSLKLAGSKHDLILMNFADPRERALPREGIYRLVDGERGTAAYLDLNNPLSRRYLAGWQKARESGLRDLVKKHRIDGIEFLVGTDYERPLLKFFAERTRRLGR
jgi:hypothetical protein